MAVEYETLVQGGHSKFAEEIFKKIKDKSLVDEVKGSDSVPYHFRQTPFGDRLKEKIIGGTVAWNQLTPTENRTINNYSYVDTRDYFSLYIRKIGAPYTVLLSKDLFAPEHIATITNASASFTGVEILHNGQISNITFLQFNDMSITQGHKYLINIDFAGVNAQVANGVNGNNIMIVDLTAMFGSTIADYIYNLEQTTAGAGVALFRELFPKDYYEYDAGSLQSVSGLQSHDEVGFNQWDEEWEVGWINTSTGASQNANDAIRSKNYIPVVGGETYYIRTTYTANNQRPYLHWYDADKNWIWYAYASTGEHGFAVTIPSNAKYLRFSVANLSTPVSYNHDICINISDPAKNGQYEPYKKHSYPLDGSLTLRGIPKLVDNKIKFDGDVYESDGKVTRRYGIVDLGTLGWLKPDAGIYGARVNNMFDPGANYQGRRKGCICALYSPSTSVAINSNDMPDKSWLRAGGSFYIRDTRYSDTATFKTAMSGVYLVYELATPTEESAQPFQSPQRCAEGGTEEYVTTGIVPVGHESEYVSNKAERFDALPDAAQEDGDYVIRQTDGIMELVDAEESSKLVESEFGNPITIVTDSAQFAKNTHLTFEPIQDLHGYDHPWPAGGGKNLCSNESDIKVGGGESRTKTISITSIPAGTYTASWDENGTAVSNIQIITGSTSTTIGNGVAFTTTASMTGLYVYVTQTDYDNAKYGLIHNLQIESGSTATSYEPYSNICPISGLDEVDIKRTGKNLFGGEANALFRLFIPSGTTVTASDLGGGNVRYYDAYQNEIDYWALINTESVSGRKYRSFIVSSDTYFVKFDVGSTTASDFQLEVGSAPTSYEPYTEYTASLDLPETVYGGTLDLETGELVCDRGMRLVSECYWYGSNGVFYTESVLASIIHGDGRFDHVISDTYKTQNVGKSDSLSDGGISVDASGYIQLRDMRYTVASDFKQAMNGVQLCYELATPVTYQLTPQQLALFKGTNVVQTNAKSVKVTYRNGKLALMDDIPQQLAVEGKKTDEKIDAKAVELLSIFAPIENGTTASNTYSVGEYFMHNGQFCKVKTEIASGATFTLNTNYEVTTVGAELYTALNS